MAIPIIVGIGIGIGIRVGIWAAGRIAARQAVKAATQAATRAATSTAGRQALSTASGINTAIQTAEMAQKLIEEADAKTGNQDVTCPTGQCNESAAKEQEEKLKELEEEAGVEQRTKGRTKHGEKSGGMEQAEKDFDSLNPDNVRDIGTGYGKGRTGELKDGRHITVRSGSRAGPPTLEIWNPINKRGVKIRYED